jgi:hypothetical protein
MATANGNSTEPRQDVSRPAASTRPSFAADSAAVTRQVYDFLGVDGSFQPDTSIRFNVSGQARHPVVGWAFEQFRGPGGFWSSTCPPPW